MSCWPCSPIYPARSELCAWCRKLEVYTLHLLIDIHDHFPECCCLSESWCHFSFISLQIVHFRTEVSTGYDIQYLKGFHQSHRGIIELAVKSTDQLVESISLDWQEWKLKLKRWRITGSNLRSVIVVSSVRLAMRISSRGSIKFRSISKCLVSIFTYWQ